jgi:hypothetical protein
LVPGTWAALSIFTAQLADFPRIGSARVNINVSFLIIV